MEQQPVAKKAKIARHTVAIIGTAGRNGLDEQLSSRVFEMMCKNAAHTIKHVFHLDPQDVELVSGGAAWSDHVAVRLFLTGEYGGLTLHLPAPWKHDKFNDTGAGGTANVLHRMFSAAMGTNTLDEIEQTRRAGAVFIDTYAGFLVRNLEVAKSEFMVAYTFSETDKPAKGGTDHTWSHCKGRKLHVPICQLDYESDQ